MSFSRLLAVPVAALALALAVAAPARASEPRVVNVEVTKEGFVPARIVAKPGESLKLVVTRKVERTCATEIVMKDFGVNQPLPLGKPVAVTVAPAKKGAYRFACGMDMIAGVLAVE
jgi:plastocyanin domain-containing protein